MAPNGAGIFFFPTDPDLADILGRMDFDFENLYFLFVFGSKISRFPNFQKSSLGQAWDGPGLGLGPLSRLFVYIIRYVGKKALEIYPKWFHMARYELILKLDGALWLRIISKPLLAPKRAME